MLSRHSSVRSQATAAAAAVGCEMSAEVESQLLRTLATLCCVEDSIVQLHQVKFLHVFTLMWKVLDLMRENQGIGWGNMTFHLSCDVFLESLLLFNYYFA